MGLDTCDVQVAAASISCSSTEYLLDGDDDLDLENILPKLMLLATRVRDFDLDLDLALTRNKSSLTRENASVALNRLS